MQNQPFSHAPPPAAPTAPGRAMLKVTGILYIIFGGMSIIMALLALLGAIVMQEPGAHYYFDADLIEAGAGYVFLISLIMLVQSGFSVFLGIMCVAHCDKVERGSFLRIIIIIHMVFLVASVILDPSLLTVIAFIVPIIAIVGASKNAKAAEYPQLPLQ